MAFRVEISVGYSGRRRNLEIINSSGIYEKRLKPAHIVMDNGDERGENGREERGGGEREKETSIAAKPTIVTARTFPNSASVLLHRVSFRRLYPSLSHMKRFIKLAPA